MYGHFHKKPLSARLAGGIWKFKWAVLCFVASGYLFASSGYIHAKALLAQHLIEDAWTTSIEQQKPVPPWSWADTFPVAKLTVANKTLYVLAGATGRTLAFGPGHLSHTPLPGQRGNSVISGHRDTHFAILEQLQVGDVVLTSTSADSSRYQVQEIRIAHEDQIELTENTNQNLLTLITCYPFDSVAPNPTLRFVVRAKLLES